MQHALNPLETYNEEILVSQIHMLSSTLLQGAGIDTMLEPGCMQHPASDYEIQESEQALASIDD